MAGPPTLGGDEPLPTAVCEHMEALRAQKTPGVERDDSCRDRMITASLLDGDLWTLRAHCILDATTVDEYSLCNGLHHPSWPPPQARATEEQVRQRLRVPD